MSDPIDRTHWSACLLLACSLHNSQLKYTQSISYFVIQATLQVSSLVFPIQISFYSTVSPVWAGFPSACHTLWSIGEVMCRAPQGTPGYQKPAGGQVLQCQSRVCRRVAALDPIRGLNGTSGMVEHGVCAQQGVRTVFLFYDQSHFCFPIGHTFSRQHSHIVIGSCFWRPVLTLSKLGPTVCASYLHVPKMKQSFTWFFCFWHGGSRNLPLKIHSCEILLNVFVPPLKDQSLSVHHTAKVTERELL